VRQMLADEAFDLGAYHGLTK